MMNKWIKRELESIRNVVFYDKQGSIIPIEEIDKHHNIIIKSREFSQSIGELLFTFDDYLLDPFSKLEFNSNFNEGRVIPLKVMQGKILKTVGKMYLISVRGYYYKSSFCNHCLKAVPSNPVCYECFRYFNVNDVEEICWEGYVPIKSCVIEEIKNEGKSSS